METLSLQELVDTACARYGQLLTPLIIYRLDDQTLESLMKSTVEEYSHFIPYRKDLKIMSSPNGTFLGDDIISVRNVRIDNFYYSKLSPRMSRRERKFDTNTKMLYMPISMQVVVECGALYPVTRTSIAKNGEVLLAGDTIYKTVLKNVREGSLRITIGDLQYTDKNSDYSKDEAILNRVLSEEEIQECTCEGCECEGECHCHDTEPDNDAVYNQKTGMLTIKNIDVSEQVYPYIQYNTDKPIIQGLGYRDRLFVDLFIGRLMLALGNLKAQLVMEGDVVEFAGEDLLSQGQKLVDTTIELLMNSSTTYKVI